MMKNIHPYEKREVIYFSVITLVLSSLICFLAYVLDNLNLSILSVFTPTLVAIVLTLKARGKSGVRELLVSQTVRKIPIKWLMISFIGIPVLASLAVLTSLNFDLSTFGLRSTQLIPQFIVIILIAIGEEYGWRGFLLPRLMKRYNVFYSSIILGMIWGFWHFPAYLIGTGVPLEMNFLVFMLWVVLGTFFMSWIYYYTKSVLTSILAHISANAAFNYLDVLPEFTGSMSVFWIFIAYLSILLVLIYYNKREDLLQKVGETG